MGDEYENFNFRRMGNGRPDPGFPTLGSLGSVTLGSWVPHDPGVPLQISLKSMRRRAVSSSTVFTLQCLQAQRAGE